MHTDHVKRQAASVLGEVPVTESALPVQGAGDEWKEEQDKEGWGGQGAEA